VHLARLLFSCILITLPHTTPHFPGRAYLSLSSFRSTDLSFSCVCQKVCYFFIFFCSLSVSSLLPFSVLQTLLCKLHSFFANVRYYFNATFVLLTRFQPPILISGDDHIHHTLIGTCLLLVFAVSNIKNRDNSHSRICMPFICLTVSTN
jgi:hypothetical protein